MKEYQINVIAGTKVLANMVETVKDATYEVTETVKTVVGGATQDTATTLAPGPLGKNRKMEKVSGWFKNSTGVAWEAPKEADNTNWWDGVIWSLGASVPLLKGKDGKTAEPFNPLKEAGYLAGDQIYFGNNKIYSVLINTIKGESPLTHPNKFKIELSDGLGDINNTDTRSPSGKRIKEVIFEGIHRSVVNNWVVGDYLTTGAERNDIVTFTRIPKTKLLKGERVFFGVNTFTGGGSTAILNIYDINGLFKECVWRNSAYPNQFFETVYTATEDCQFGISNYDSANFGVKYARIEHYDEIYLNKLNAESTAHTSQIDVITNGINEVFPPSVININKDGYWLTTGGTVAGVGHKRTDKFLLHKGQSFNYGLNMFTSVGSVGSIVLFNLNGTFKSVALRPATATLGKFVTGTYTATEEVMVGCSDYFDGAYGVAYINILESTPENYKKGINYLIAQDSIKVNPSDYEAASLFRVGAARQNVLTNRKLAVIIAGQSHIAGVLDLSTIIAAIASNDLTVPFSQMWNHGSRIFAPWKFGVNTGEGMLTSIRTLYGFDCIAVYKWGQYLNKTIHVIKNARGGTAIDLAGSKGGGYWTPYIEDIPAGSLKMIDDLKFKVLSALQTNPDLDIKAVIWHQGEGDATPEAEVKYYQNFKNVISYIRGIANNPKLLFICGTITPLSSQYSQKVHDAQVRIAQEDPFVKLIDMSDGTVFDGVHFDPASTELFADRVFNVLKTIA